MDQDIEYHKILDSIRGSVDSRYIGQYHVPQLIIDVLRQLLVGQTATKVCDPWAGIGRIIAELQKNTGAQTAVALAKNDKEVEVGKTIARDADWYIGDPLHMVNELPNDFDVVASCLPFGGKTSEPFIATQTSGETIEIKGTISDRYVVAFSKKLKHEGVAIFIVTPSFFFSQTSALKYFDSLGIGVEAALALPSGTFSPYTGVSTYLLITKNRIVPKMFVAELSNDATTNLQIISNFKQGKEGGSLELGRYVDAQSFRGLEDIRRAEKFRQAEISFGTAPVRLEEIATAINIGRSGDKYSFPEINNAIFIPLVGVSDVVDSRDDLKLKNQNYAQVAINAAYSDAKFVARFLNSEFGREIRALYMAGDVIPKINKRSLAHLEIFIPDLKTQRELLEVETQIAAEQNILLGLQNEIAEYRRDLWNNPKSSPQIADKLKLLSGRLSGELKQQVDESFEHWVETLPFPLASILRTWQATESQDYDSKVDLLLHFFEATAEFLSVILISALSVNLDYFEPHKQKLISTTQSQSLSYTRATFGTWKVTVEYLGKQTRQLLSGDKDTRDFCADVFSSPSLELPKMLSNKKLGTVLSKANKMRNDWGGHKGYVSPEESRLRNEQLLGVLQEFREVTSGVWHQTQLVNALYCKPRKGIFENEVSILMGSNSEFLKEKREMSEYLDVDRLYLVSKDSSRALKLLPLIEIGPSPQSAKNACYFFNRVENEGVRFIAYHFSDKPERIEPIPDLSGVMKLFIEGV